MVEHFKNWHWTAKDKWAKYKGNWPNHKRIHTFTKYSICVWCSNSNKLNITYTGVECRVSKVWGRHLVYVWFTVVSQVWERPFNNVVNLNEIMFNLMPTQCMVVLPMSLPKWWRCRMIVIDLRSDTLPIAWWCYRRSWLNATALFY